jgi:hypothetical protein
MPAIITLLNPAHRRGVKRRRGNPASLVIINGKRRSTTMAVRRRRRAAAPKRRRRTNRRRVTTVVNRRRRRANPVRRRRRRAAPRVNRRRRRSNPVRRHRRRRNPSILGSAGGLLEQAITAIIGMGITNFAFGFVGSMNPAGMAGQIGIKLGLAIGLKMAATKFGFSKYANMLAVGGAVSAGQDALNYFVGGGGALFPSAVPVAAGRAAFPADTGMPNDGSMADIGYANPSLFNDVAYGNPSLFN